MFKDGISVASWHFAAGLTILGWMVYQFHSNYTAADGVPIMF